MVRVMVVDDHPMWRDAVERDLQAAGHDVVAVASNGREAIARFPAAAPQVVVLDLQLPDSTGVEITTMMLKHDPTTRVLILSASGEQADVLEAIKAGATGYLVKSASSAELINAVERVADGEAVFTPGLAGLVLGEFRRIADGPADDPVDQLTERETEILKMVATGMCYKQIAAAARAVAPHRAEPRPEHAAQAPDEQPRPADALGHRARARRRAGAAEASGLDRDRQSEWRTATDDDAVALRDLERVSSSAGLAHVFGDLPYPDDDVLARWVLVLADPEVTVEVVEDADGASSRSRRTTATRCGTSASVLTTGERPGPRGHRARGGGRRHVPVGAGRQPPGAGALRSSAGRRRARPRSARGRPTRPSCATPLPRIDSMPDPMLAIADELYGLPLADFTPARDALVKEHKADKARAAAIKGLRKASVAAWVVNLLVRRDPEQVDQVVAVGAALRDAQDNLDATQLREFTKQRRQLTAAVTTTARRFAREEGVKVTQSVADQVEDTITAAMLDPEAARAVRSGLLVSALEATGLGDLDLTGAVALPDALGFEATARPVAAPDPTERPQLHVVPDPEADQKARAAADERVARAKAELATAQKDDRAARRAVEKLQAKTLQLQSEIDELRSRIAAVESSLEDIDDELGEAEAEQAEAEETVTEAQAAVDAAKAARERLR